MGGGKGRWGAALAGTLLVTALLATDAVLQKRRKTALVQGDILIGALFSVHHQPKQKSASTLTCGVVSILLCLRINKCVLCVFVCTVPVYLILIRVLHKFVNSQPDTELVGF